MATGTNQPLWAVMHRRLAALDAALTQGADPNRPDPQGRTALHWAALLGDADSAQRLLEGGANVELRDGRGMTALGYAVLPVAQTPLPRRTSSPGNDADSGDEDERRAEVRRTLLAAGANWHASVDGAPSPWELYVRWWPKQAEQALPHVGPVR